MIMLVDFETFWGGADVGPGSPPVPVWCRGVSFWAHLWSRGSLKRSRNLDEAAS
jgi:hypothetical protein